MTKSRTNELTPPHKCNQCGVKHFYIEPMAIPVRNPKGELVVVPLIPLEIMIVADGSVTLQTDQEPTITSKVPVIGMLWGVPGSGNNQVSSKSVIVLN